MNLQQFRFLREAARQKFNITAAARALHASQPGVSKAIIELEDELGVSIFARAGKRILGLTPPGQQVLLAAERIMQEVDNLKKLSRDYAGAPSGTLRVATTHTQARYLLPPVVRQFAQKYPQVRLKLLQADPPQIARMLVNGEADIGIATESLDHFDELVALPAYTWTHSVVVPPDHPLAREKALTLEAIATYPVVTYSKEFTGRSHIDGAFADRGLSPDIVLTAIDSDVIKTYVELGLGVGIIASVAFDPERDRQLKCFGAAGLFPINTTRVAVRRGAYLRDFTFAFIESFASELVRERVIEAMADRQTTDAASQH